MGSRLPHRRQGHVFGGWRLPSFLPIFTLCNNSNNGNAKNKSSSFDHDGNPPFTSSVPSPPMAYYTHLGLKIQSAHTSGQPKNQDQSCNPPYSFSRRQLLTFQLILSSFAENKTKIFHATNAPHQYSPAMLCVFHNMALNACPRSFMS